MLFTSPLDSSGKATFTTSSLAVGSDPITAVYAATGGFLGSSSTPLTHVVTAAGLQGATTQITSSASPSTVGQTVVVTATVVATSGAGTPTGTIVFTIDGRGGSPVDLNEIDGKVQAIFLMPVLAAGSYSISADYSGDAVFAPGDSNTITQVVNPAVTMPPPVTNSTSDGPQITSVLRYGYHMRPTTVLLTFDQALEATTAEDVDDYSIIGPGGHVIPIKKPRFTTRRR